MKTNPHIISTKSLSLELVRRLQSVHIKLSQYDFIEKIISLPVDFNKGSLYPAIALTSKTAAYAWIEMVNRFGLDASRYNIYSLTSGEKILGGGKGVRIRGVASDAASLVGIILKDRGIKNVSFICGNRRLGILPNTLIKNGISVREVIAYKTMLTPVEIKRKPRGILFFSPSAIDSYCSVNNNRMSTAFCIGQTTAHHALSLGFSKVLVADTPSPESLVTKVVRYYSNQSIYA